MLSGEVLQFLISERKRVTLSYVFIEQSIGVRRTDMQSVVHLRSMLAVRKPSVVLYVTPPLKETLTRSRDVALRNFQD